MDKQHLHHFAQLFRELKKSTERELEEALDLGETNRGDEADRWSMEQNNSLNLKLIARTRHFKNKIELSLKRIEEGTFGECQDCGAEISLARLMARPTAELCIRCKEEQEGSEKHIPYDRRSHTHGQALVSGSDNVLSFQGGDDRSKAQAFERQQLL